MGISLNVEVDEDQLYEAVSELDRSDQLQLAKDILDEHGDRYKKDVLEDLSDDEVIELVKERLEGWVKAPADVDEIRSLLEYVSEAAIKVGLIAARVAA